MKEDKMVSTLLEEIRKTQVMLEKIESFYQDFNNTELHM